MTVASTLLAVSIGGTSCCFKKTTSYAIPPCLFFLSYFLTTGDMRGYSSLESRGLALLSGRVRGKETLSFRLQDADPPRSVPRQHARQARRFAKTFAAAHSIRLSLNRIGNNAALLKIITIRAKVDCRIS